MKITNNIFSIITLLFFIVTTGCVNEAFEMESTEVSKTITIKGVMPGEKTGTRVIISQKDGSLDLTAVWHPLDLVTFYFVQGNTVIMGGQTVVSDISVDGKRCSLVITIPQGVDSEKSFDLYGFTGAETHLKDGEILVDVTPNLNRKINNISAPVWFVKKGVTVTTTELAVNFDHLGAYEIVHLKNNTSGEFLFKECGLVAKSTGNKEWAYLSLPEAENSTQVPYFKPISGTVEMHTEQRNTSDDIGDLLIISPGRTLAVVSWYMPKDMNLPDLQLLLKADGLDKISVNEKQAKDFGMEKGNAYHVYAVWDGNELYVKESNVSNNLLAIFAEYNVGITPGTFATSHSNYASGSYKWEEAQGACPRGYRVPTVEELRLLIPHIVFRWDEPRKMTNFSENIHIKGKLELLYSDCSSSGNGILYAIRFKDNLYNNNKYRTAYRYEAKGNFSSGDLDSHLQITTVYLGNSNVSTTISDISDETWWAARTAESKSIILPAAQSRPGNPRSFGAYWSSTTMGGDSLSAYYAFFDFSGCYIDLEGNFGNYLGSGIVRCVRE
ncbi:MAG TPA: hypothetical protein GXX64_09125 [Bacteroidales bacterium]|jgi:hypothetical protein|nr:hypothetical protein [Bacteroidales bacterium]